MSGEVKNKKRRSVSVSGAPREALVTIEKSEAVRYVTKKTLFGSSAGTAANPNSISANTVAASTCTTTLLSHQSTRITTTTASASTIAAAATTAKPFDIGIEIVFGTKSSSYEGQYQPTANKRAFVDNMIRSRRTSSLRGVSAPHSKEKPISSQEEHKREHIPKKRAPSSSKPQMVPSNSELTPKMIMPPIEANKKEPNQNESNPVVNQLLQINETFSPHVDIETYCDKLVAKTNKPKRRRKSSGRTVSLKSKRNKAKKTSSQPTSTTRSRSAQKKAAEVIKNKKVANLNLFLREKFDFLTEQQLEGLIRFKVLRPEMVLHLSLWQLNSIGIKGEQLDAILSVLVNGQKGEEQNAPTHNKAQNQQQITQMPYGDSKDNDDDEEQALVIDETVNAFQEIENITCSPNADGSLCCYAPDEDPIRLSPLSTIDELCLTLGAIKKSLLHLQNSNEPNAEKKTKVESFLNQLDVLDQKYLLLKSKSSNSDNNNLQNEQQPTQPLNEQNVFTFNLPTATSIFTLADRQIVEVNDKPQPTATTNDENSADDAIKKMILRSKSKFDENRTSEEKLPTQVPKKESKEAFKKNVKIKSTTDYSNKSESSKSRRLKFIRNPAAAAFMAKDQMSKLNEKTAVPVSLNAPPFAGSNEKTVQKIVKCVRFVQQNKVARNPIEIIDLVINDKTHPQTDASKIVPVENKIQNVILCNDKTLPNYAVKNTSAVVPKFVTSVTEENIASYASKLNFNIQEIRNNLDINTFSNPTENKQFDLTITQQNCQEKCPHSFTSNDMLEEQLIVPPEVFRFYSSQENSPESSHNLENNSTNVFTKDESFCSNQKSLNLISTLAIQGKDKQPAEYQNAFNTFVHSELQENVPGRDADSASSQSSDKTDVSKPLPSTCVLLSSSSHAVAQTSNNNDCAQVTSHEVFKAAPLKTITTFDNTATTSAAPEESDLRECLNQLHYKKSNLLPALNSVKQEIDIGRIHMTNIKLEKANDGIDSTTKSPELIFNAKSVKRKDNPINKLTTAIPLNIGPRLRKISHQRITDADSTTRSPDLIFNKNDKAILRTKKERQVDDKSHETENPFMDKPQSRPKENKIMLKRSFNLKPKDDTNVPKSPSKRSKYDSSTLRLHSPTPSLQSNKSRQWKSKNSDKLPTAPSSAHYTQQKQQQRSSSSSSSTKVDYAHTNPATVAESPLSPPIYSGQSPSTSLLRQNELIGSRRKVGKVDLRQEPKKAYFKQNHNPSQTLLSPKKEICVPSTPMDKSYDETEKVYHNPYQSNDNWNTDNDDNDNKYKNMELCIESSVKEEEEKADNKNNLRHLISHKATRKINFNSKSDDYNNDINCSDTGLDALSIASPEFSPLSSVEIASPASPKNSLSYYTSAPEMDGQMGCPPMPYMLYEIVIPKEVNKPPANLLQIKTEDPRLSKYIKTNINQNYSDSIMSPTRADPRMHRNASLSSDTSMSQQQPHQQQMQQQQQIQQQQQMQQQQQLQQQQQQMQPNMVLYNCLQHSPWYQGLMSTMKIQINQCISELVRALNNFQKERLVDHTAVFDIFKIDCACELLEIMRSLCISIDMNGVITDQKNYYMPSGGIGGAMGGGVGLRCSLVPSMPIKATYSFVQPEMSSHARIVAAPPQSPMRHSSPFVSRYLDAPQPTPRCFDSRRQCGSKTPYMSRPPPQDRKRSYERSTQERERCNDRPNQRMIPTTVSCSNDRPIDNSEEECWD